MGADPGRCPAQVKGVVELRCDLTVGHLGEHVAVHHGSAFCWPSDAGRDTGRSFADALRDGLRAHDRPYQVRDLGEALGAAHEAGHPPTLGQVLDAQLTEINASLPPDWHGKVEIEPVPPELTDTYDVAFGSAVRNCDHSGSSHSTQLSKGERQCDDCGRYFIRRRWYE